MASITGYGSKHSHEFTLRVDETGTNVSNNTSTISFSFTLYKSSYSWSGWNNITYSISINGTTYSGTIPNYSAGNTLTIHSGTQTIEHDANGSKSIGFSFSVTDNSGQSYTCGNANANGSMTLTTIPRASSISCTTANVEETAVIIINSASPNFIHRIWCDFGNLIEYVIFPSVAGGSYSWTIPSSFYAQMPNNKTKTGTIFCRTYLNGVEIGLTTSILTITTSEERCRPTLSASVEDINQDTIALTGDSNKLVRYKSTASITITATAKNSASISNKKVNNSTVSGNTISISNVESTSFTVIVTDTRGYSNSIVLSPTVIQYVNLSINANIQRTQPTTGEIDIEFSGNYFNSNFGATSNSLSIRWFYREKNIQNWTLGGTLTPVISNNTFSNGNSKISLGNSFNYQKTYEFYLEVRDELITLQPTYTVTQGIPVFNWGEGFFNVNEDILYKGKPVSQGLNVFTTTEHVVGSWIDGKPIYRKVITYSKTEGGDFRFNHNISNMETYWLGGESNINYNGDVTSINMINDPGNLSYQWRKAIISSVEISGFIGVYTIGTLPWTGTFFVYYTKTTD